MSQFARFQFLLVSLHKFEDVPNTLTLSLTGDEQAGIEHLIPCGRIQRLAMVLNRCLDILGELSVHRGLVA